MNDTIFLNFFIVLCFTLSMTKGGWGDLFILRKYLSMSQAVYCTSLSLPAPYFFNKNKNPHSVCECSRVEN